MFLGDQAQELSTLFPTQLPTAGLGERTATALVSRQINEQSARLDAATALAHMDPPPPEIAVEITRLNAAYNQNLLHPDLSPATSRAEDCVIRWIADEFAMDNGHMCGGSTLANLTALWAAREHGVNAVIASADAHLSIGKAAHILGLPFVTLETTPAGKIKLEEAPDLTSAALVLTAGTTGRGVIDPLTHAAASTARWLHIDAAWAGPMQLTRYRPLLRGIEAADSISISAHKWFFQPKESALCLFNSSASRDAVSFGSSYLAQPNVGVQGSRGAAALTLLATLLAWGRDGLDERIHACMALAEALAERLQDNEKTELRSWPETAVINWRPAGGVTPTVSNPLKGVASTVVIDDEQWMRNVVANPHAQLDAVCTQIAAVL